jgi:glycosyltransferase involved in cell wall biosynthesis
LSSHKNKRVSIIAHDLAGGGMTRAYALAQALAHVGHETEIIGIKLNSGPVYPVPPENINVTEVSGFCMVHRIWKLLSRLNGDVVYAIKPRPSSYGVALLKRFIAGCPVVLDIDDWEPGERESRCKEHASSHSQKNRILGKARSLKARLHGYLNFRRWLNPNDDRYIRWLERTTHWADAITVNTSFLQQCYGGFYVPHCKDISKYDPNKYDPGESRMRYGLADYIVLMFPGTARPHKGLEDLLVAIETLQNPDVRLVLVGGRNSNDPYVTELIERWGQWIVRMPTFSTRIMPEVVAAAHVVVIPQRDTSVARAQFPMKLTDAMAMAKPILTTTVGDIPEILDGTGYLVQPSRPEELAEMLAHLLKESQSAENHAMKARERFIRNYSLGVVGPTLSAVIEALP